MEVHSHLWKCISKNKQQKRHLLNKHDLASRFLKLFFSTRCRKLLAVYKRNLTFFLLWCYSSQTKREKHWNPSINAKIEIANWPKTFYLEERFERTLGGSAVKGEPWKFLSWQVNYQEGNVCVWTNTWTPPPPTCCEMGSLQLHCHIRRCNFSPVAVSNQVELPHLITRYKKSSIEVN